MTTVLALDVGSSSARAQAYDARGEPLGEPVHHRYSTQATLDADRLVRTAAEVLAHGAGGDAVAVCTFWHSLVPVDARGRALAPLSTWRDLAAAPQARRLAARLDPAEVHVRTGCPLHPSFWPAKLARLREDEPELFAAAARFVGFGELLHFRLSGTWAASRSSASGTGLLRADGGGWDDVVLEAVGVGPERLPPIDDRPAEYAGRPLLPALGDGACSNLGVGAVSAERAALTLGTSGALRVVRSDAVAAPRPGLFLLRLDERRSVEGGSLSDGGNLLGWLRRTLRLDEPPDVRGRPPLAHGLTFLPLLGGERSPGWDADARGAVSGLSFRTTPLDVWQAALEGLALRFAEIAQRLPELQEVVATGGAARTPGLLQIVADALGVPVTASAVAEGSARGAAVAALEQLGERPAPAPLGGTVAPRGDWTAAYREARERQRGLYRAAASG